ncbi:MAG TPA: hypothetical protein PLK94_00310 [Alphaproteobacteria bacterium]|nr:hypothetical protein [Alphaproteobacteria bacterium]HOO49707.1 hypothetical protein [Alphaproteobacteria bacterium]
MDHGIAFYIWTTCSVVVALIVSYIAIFHTSKFNQLMATAFPGEYSHREFEPLPIYHPQRIWRIAVILLSVLGSGTLFYGIFIRLLGWMPYDWRTEDGDWLAEYYSLWAAIFSIIGMVAFTEGLQKLVARHCALEGYRLTSERFNDILYRILTCPREALDFWAKHGECVLGYQSDVGFICRDEAEHLTTVIKIIGQYRQNPHTGVAVQKWIKNTVRHRINGGVWIDDDAQHISDKAKDLINFVKQYRYDLEPFGLVDEKLRDLILKSPDGWSPPKFYKGGEVTSCVGSTSIKTTYEQQQQRLIEKIIWADQLGAIDAVDEFFRRNKA